MAKTPLGLVVTRNASVAASGEGRTQFAIEVNFGAFVDVVRNDELLVDVLTATAVRNKLAWAPTTGETRAATTTRRFGLVNVAATGGPAGTPAGGVLTIFADLNADSTALPAVDADAAPTRKVRYEFETSQVRFLPMARDLVETTAGHAGATAVTGPDRRWLHTSVRCAASQSCGVTRGEATSARRGCRWSRSRRSLSGTRARRR